MRYQDKAEVRLPAGRDGYGRPTAETLVGTVSVRVVQIARERRTDSDGDRSHYDAVVYVQEGRGQAHQAYQALLTGQDAVLTLRGERYRLARYEQEEGRSETYLKAKLVLL